jgi:uncharacterized membrane protein (Fun14 family)
LLRVLDQRQLLWGGFFAGVLIGYALKKVIKLVAVIVGLFLAGLAYLQSQQIANINWNKLQTVSEGTITTVSNGLTQIPYIMVTVAIAAMLLQQLHH